MKTDIMKQLENIKYGWKDKNGSIHINDFDTFSDDYILQSPSEVLESCVGVCWDQVELERILFDKENIEFNTYFIVHYDNDKCPTHTFLIYKDNDKYYWFEHSWEIFKGIHEYNNEEDAIKDIRNKFVESEVNYNYDEECLYIYKYSKPSYGLSCSDFYNHCEQGEEITLT